MVGYLKVCILTETKLTVESARLVWSYLSLPVFNKVACLAVFHLNVALPRPACPVMAPSGCV